MDVEHMDQEEIHPLYLEKNLQLAENLKQRAHKLEKIKKRLAKMIAFLLKILYKKKKWDFGGLLYDI